jgi:hypothetical protein
MSRCFRTRKNAAKTSKNELGRDQLIIEDLTIMIPLKSGIARHALARPHTKAVEVGFQTKLVGGH